MGLLEKVFGNYSQKEIKRLQPTVNKVLALDEKFSAMSDAELRGHDRYAPGPSRRRRDPRGYPPRGLCHLPGGQLACAGDEALPGADPRLAGAPPGPDRRDEDRRGQNPRRHPGLLSQRPRGQGRPMWSPSMTTWPAATPSGWARCTTTSASPSAWWSTAWTAPSAKKAYAADITYGTNNEFGFDYLRDNMVTTKARQVQRGHNFAIVGRGGLDPHR